MGVVTADGTLVLDELGVDVGEGKGVMGAMVDVGGGGGVGVGPGMVGAAVGVMPSTASATVAGRLNKNVRKSATTIAIWMMPAVVSILAFIILISPPCLRSPWLPSWASYAPRIIVGKKIELGKSTTVVFNFIAGSPKR